jgi:hypothetical protein
MASAKEMKARELQSWSSRCGRTRAPGLLAPPICSAGLAILAGRPHNEA